MRGTGTDSVEDLIVAAENLPGYQSLWVSPNHTDIIPFFYPVGGSTSPDPTPSATSPRHTGTTTTSAFTAEQRGWAEAVVGDVLRSVGEPGQPDVTARMTKVTYGQYTSVWNIDIPQPPGPTPDDAEIIVVALSTSLDGSSMHGGPPSLTTPDPTASQTPHEPIGTVTVMDPGTGESLLHVTVLGGDPPTDLLMNLPGPIEDVALPRGFR